MTLSKIHGFISTLVVAVLLTACAPTIDKRGKPLDPKDLQQVQPGRHTKVDVTRILGSPTLVDKFDQDTWFYLYRLTHTTAFLQPDEKDMKIIAVNFHKDGIVREVKKFGVSGTRDVPIVSRETPTKGRDVGYLEQIFGNFGRIHRGDAKGME